MMNRKLAPLGIVIALFSVILRAHAADMPPGLVMGTWDAGGRMFEGLALKVTRKTVTLGSCKAVPYVFIADRDGYGLKTTPSMPGAKWHEFAIELMPGNRKQERCLAREFRVLVFSIPEQNKCHADITMFHSRADYERQANWAWGVWGNMTCNPAR